MCFCEDADSPSCFRQVTRTARKAHRCVECRNTIQPGERYEYTSGIWDGMPDDHKTCLACVFLRETHIEADKRSEVEKLKEHRPDFSPIACNPVIGELLEQIGECSREDPVYLRHFRVVRRELGCGVIEKIR